MLDICVFIRYNVITNKQEREVQTTEDVKNYPKESRKGGMVQCTDNHLRFYFQPKGKHDAPPDGIRD